MKNRIIVPKLSKIFFCLSAVLFLPCLILDILENNDMFFYLPVFKLNITNISPLLCVIAIILFAVPLVLLIIKNIKNKLISSVSIAVVLALLLYACLIQVLFYKTETYIEIVSPDNKHIVLVSEVDIFQAGIIKFYEQTSPFFIEEIAVCSTDDCVSSIKDNDYKIVWNDNGFDFYYCDGDTTDEYKFEKIEYVKW